MDTDEAVEFLNERHVQASERAALAELRALCERVLGWHQNSRGYQCGVYPCAWCRDALAALARLGGDG